MPTEASVRKALRNFPSFQALDTEALDEVSAQLHRQHYQSRTHMWLADDIDSLLLVVQSGKVHIRGRTSAWGHYRKTLKSGDVFCLSIFRSENDLYDTYLSIIPGTTLYLLDKEPFTTFVGSRVRGLRGTEGEKKRSKRLSDRVLAAFLAAFLVFLFWSDLSRLAAGGLYFLSDRLSRANHDLLSWVLMNLSVDVDPEAYYVYAKKGYLQYTRGNLDRARRLLEHSVQLNAGYSPALNNVAVVNFEQASRQLAIELQSEAVRVAPHSAVVNHNMGTMWLQQGDFQQAEYAFREATRIDPDWPLPYVYLAYTHLKTRDYSEAESVSLHALQLDQESFVAHMVLTLSLYEQRKLRESIEVISFVTEAYPEATLPKFYHASMLRDLGKYQEAICEFEEILLLEPDMALQERLLLEIERIKRIRPGISSAVCGI